MRSPLLRFLAHHCLVGMAIGWIILGGLLWSDVGRLGTLIFNSPHWPEAIALLLIFFAITFGSLSMGTGIMLLSDEDEDSKGGGKRSAFDKLKALSNDPQGAPKLAPLRVKARRR
ncbi:MAG: hypothetical protein AAFY02_21285 [Pseudomonadota bacterium]